MVTIVSLWLPILVATVAVFFLSFVMWMVLPHHKSDWKGLADEDALMGTLREQGTRRGQYMFPHCSGPEKMKDPEFMKKFSKGPSGLVVLRPTGGFHMGKSMATSTTFNLVVTVCVAYCTTFTLTTASAPMDVFRLTGTVAFLAYAAALGWGPIWFSRTWSSTIKEMFDGLVYGVATGLVFMALWP